MLRHFVEIEIQVTLLAAAGVAAAAIGVLSACVPSKTSAARAPVALLADGQLPMPADYRNWPKFLSAIQRDDAEQVREIYMNPVARTGTTDKGFPNGSVLVMESYVAATHPDGSLQRGDDGLLIKGALLRIFVMGKNAGWGTAAPAGMKTGDWIFACYLEGGAKAPNPLQSCRSCHQPMAGKDFVYRLDEYLAKPLSWKKSSQG